MENSDRIEVIKMADEETGFEFDTCSLYCPTDCGCENAWTDCFSGD